jgi:hypothetical protein
MGILSSLRRMFGGGEAGSTGSSPSSVTGTRRSPSVSTAGRVAGGDPRAVRLAHEKAVVDRYFPGFTWRNPQRDTRLTGKVRTNPGSSYQLEVRLPDDYPDSCPSVYVTSPALKMKTGAALPSPSHQMHTLSPDSDGHPQICHYHPNSWTMDNSIYLVLMKARLWLEAYEFHLQTGDPIEHFLADQDG